MQSRSKLWWEAAALLTGQVDFAAECVGVNFPMPREYTNLKVADHMEGLECMQY